MTREVHEEYAVQRWPETKRLLGLLVNSSGGAHARNARRLVHAARQQDRRLSAALLAAATPAHRRGRRGHQRRAHADVAQAGRAGPRAAAQLPEGPRQGQAPAAPQDRWGRGERARGGRRRDGGHRDHRRRVSSHRGAEAAALALAAQDRGRRSRSESPGVEDEPQAKPTRTRARRTPAAAAEAPADATATPEAPEAPPAEPESPPAEPESPPAEAAPKPKTTRARRKPAATPEPSTAEEEAPKPTRARRKPAAATKAAAKPRARRATAAKKTSDNGVPNPLEAASEAVRAAVRGASGEDAESSCSAPESEVRGQLPGASPRLAPADDLASTPGTSQVIGERQPRRCVPLSAPELTTRDASRPPARAPRPHRGRSPTRRRARRAARPRHRSGAEARAAGPLQPPPQQRVALAERRHDRRHSLRQPHLERPQQLGQRGLELARRAPERARDRLQLRRQRRTSTATLTPIPSTAQPSCGRASTRIPATLRPSSQHVVGPLDRAPGRPATSATASPARSGSSVVELAQHQRRSSARARRARPSVRPWRPRPAVCSPAVTSVPCGAPAVGQLARAVVGRADLAQVQARAAERHARSSRTSSPARRPSSAAALPPLTASASAPPASS